MITNWRRGTAKRWQGACKGERQATATVAEPQVPVAKLAVPGAELLVFYWQLCLPSMTGLASPLSYTDLG